MAAPALAHMLAARGLGVAVVSETTLSHWDTVTVIAIDDVAARSQLGVVWRDPPSPATRAFLTALSLDDSSGTLL